MLELRNFVDEGMEKGLKERIQNLLEEIPNEKRESFLNFLTSLDSNNDLFSKEFSEDSKGKISQYKIISKYVDSREESREISDAFYSTKTLDEALEVARLYKDYVENLDITTREQLLII